MVDYSKFANIEDSDDEDVKPKPQPKPYIYPTDEGTWKADMTWTNEEETATLVLRVPDVVTAEKDFKASFREEALDLEIFNPPLGKISLGCPAIVPLKCYALLDQMTTKEVKESRDPRLSRCIRITLVKRDAALWASDTFGAGLSTGVDSTASNGKGAKESSASPPKTTESEAGGSSSTGAQTGSYGWRHVDKHVDVWMTFPKTTNRKDLKIETTPTQLKVTANVDGEPAVFQRRWWKKVDPEELTWELEREDGPTDAPDFLRKPGIRLLHIEVDMAELERWDTVFAA